MFKTMSGDLILCPPGIRKIPTLPIALHGDATLKMKYDEGHWNHEALNASMVFLFSSSLLLQLQAQYEVFRAKMPSLWGHWVAISPNGNFVASTREEDTQALAFQVHQSHFQKLCLYSLIGFWA